MAFHSRTSVYDHLLTVRSGRGAGFLMLLDPDRASSESLAKSARQAEEAGVDALLIGTSLMMGDGFGESVQVVREAVDIPVIIFPGARTQVTPHADALLFLSLLSGRNPEYLIGEQVRSAPLIRSLGIETIATAYLLVESGHRTSVEFMSGTMPLPAGKPDIALAHALAAEMFGMKLVYLEAGSGAADPVSDDLVRTVAEGISLPVMVGGGIRNPETVAAKVAAGASFVVVGNHLEDPDNRDRLAAFAAAAHSG